VTEILARTPQGSIRGRWFLPDSGDTVRGSVVVASAMGVLQSYYAPFAEYLASRGLATLTFDYRGIGESTLDPGCDVSLHAWGEIDLVAAVASARARHPGVPMHFVGHSVGGQIFGLLSDAPFASALFVACQSGYFMNWPGPAKVAMAALWYVGIPWSVRATGRLPMKAFRQGEDVPAGVAREWSQWGRDPRYVLSYVDGLPDRSDRAFERFTAPLRSYAFRDDRLAPPATVRALAEFYRGTHTDLRVISPRELGVRSIGHFGFFRAMFRESLWAEAHAWLRENAPVPAQRPSR